MKKGFTLVEMLVVIGILGILMGVLVSSFSGGTDSARAAKCLTNMKNLASACQSYGMANGRYPFAGSIECMKVDSSGVRSSGSVKKEYYELPGWVSWYSNSGYSGATPSHIASSSWFTSAYDQDRDAREYCLTNGALWKYVSSNRELYVCPDHKIKYGKTPPAWSYVMSSKFRWAGQDASPKGDGFNGVGFTDLKRADRKLLFAEMPFVKDDVVDIDVKTGTGAGIDCDCVLQYGDSEGAEVIGFNHKSGKRNRCAHVVFADGHTEKVAWPKGGMSNSELRELTKWLCEGTDFSFDGKTYKEMK